MKPLITEKRIRDKVFELAEEIAKDNNSGQLHVLFVLKGAFIFCADIIRVLGIHDIDITLDFIAAKSYLGTESTGDVKFSMDVEIRGKEVLLLEDIIDTGRTLKRLKEELLKMQPKSLKTVCLLDKPSRRVVDIQPDYVGFEIIDRFVVGYGLDCDEQYRHLPYIAVIEQIKSD
jgi:hypoxanthine phosphoribosyltransferase